MLGTYSITQIKILELNWSSLAKIRCELHQAVGSILVRGVDAPLPPEAKKILKI